MDSVPGEWFPEWLTNYPAISSKETLRLMAAIVPPRDWTDIHWPNIAGSEAARWIAVLPLAATEQHGPGVVEARIAGAVDQLARTQRRIEFRE